jgi:hypothetical protein
MDAPPLPSRPVSSRPHWTIPVSREETLTVREKFRAVSWRQPNHKPSTTKIVARAKSVWDRYVTPDDLRHPVVSAVADRMLSDIVSISVSTLIDTY